MYYFCDTLLHIVCDVVVFGFVFVLSIYTALLLSSFIVDICIQQNETLFRRHRCRRTSMLFLYANLYHKDIAALLSLILFWREIIPPKQLQQHRSQQMIFHSVIQKIETLECRNTMTQARNRMIQTTMPRHTTPNKIQNGKILRKEREKERENARYTIL